MTCEHWKAVNKNHFSTSQAQIFNWDLLICQMMSQLFNTFSRWCQFLPCKKTQLRSIGESKKFTSVILLSSFCWFFFLRLQRQKLHNDDAVLEEYLECAVAVSGHQFREWETQSLQFCHRHNGSTQFEPESRLSFLVAFMLQSWLLPLAFRTSLYSLGVVGFTMHTITTFSWNDHDFSAAEEMLKMKSVVSGTDVLDACRIGPANTKSTVVIILFFFGALLRDVVKKYCKTTYGKLFCQFSNSGQEYDKTDQSFFFKAFAPCMYANGRFEK